MEVLMHTTPPHTSDPSGPFKRARTPCEEAIWGSYAHVTSRNPITCGRSNELSERMTIRLLLVEWGQ